GHRSVGVRGRWLAAVLTCGEGATLSHWSAAALWGIRPGVRQGHGTRAAFREDRARDRHLRVAGYTVTRLAWSQLDDEPAAIAADLRALLSSGSARPGEQT
ncbi:MAG TPA: hypothetical protein VGO24_12360, partial [Solirubrobacterales bacterium]|nr:hypothetical protein [Solirubrobacterales bacterium]